ncbi:MAG TPA: hypothetical protein VHW64_03805 [Nocardioides sp.]|uniref:hypothetical protein n=1 Tax=Nocardioides sp. TaxID=35761 RepID=UPI002E34CCBD|nr:hypothetical protein [Nocardioides sp.]HEX3929801.1 hypothetical protein [Nocardioides sp.]
MNIKALAHTHDHLEPRGSAGISRRTVARTAAWAVPVVSVAMAAPAFAAASGGCQQRGAGTMRIDNKTGVVTTLVFPGSVTATVTITQVRAGKTYQPFTDKETGRIFTTDYATPWDYLRLHHAKGMRTGDVITMTITFSQAVSGFGFTITDIDGDQGEWIDQVRVSPETFSVLSTGSDVLGAGTSGSPFRSDPSDPGNIDSADGDATLVWPGAQTQFTIVYQAADTPDKDGDVNTSSIGQMVGIGRFTYDNCG